MNQRYKDLTGKRFGRLVVLVCVQRASRMNNRRTEYKCQCNCGNILVVESYHLKSGHTQSCGCLQSERTSKSNKTHGLSNHRLCGIWHGIKKRCYNKKAKEYKNYGGRGIGMCMEWRGDILCFYRWAISHGYNDNLSIDRIDANGDYEPSNCRWANKAVQQRNRRCNHYLTINNETKCLSEWIGRTGVKFNTAKKRLRLGWSPEEAVGLAERRKAI